jgi:hypothetical protein
VVIISHRDQRVLHICKGTCGGDEYAEWMFLLTILERKRLTDEDIIYDA